jgi:hypothetical protein
LITQGAYWLLVITDGLEFVIALTISVAFKQLTAGILASIQES